MLAAAGFNFKRMMNKWKSSLWHYLKLIFIMLKLQPKYLLGWNKFTN